MEGKWSTNKLDTAKFIGRHAQMVKKNTSGTSTADIIRKAHELYKVKDSLGNNFGYEHCCVLLRDHLKYSDG